MITDEKTSIKLLNLAPKEDKNLYTYYHYIEDLLKEIHRGDQVINSDRNIVMLSPTK